MFGNTLDEEGFESQISALFCQDFSVEDGAAGCEAPGTIPPTDGPQGAAERNPLVSIIIVTRNTRDLLREAIRSVEASRTSFPTELVLVDNGSTDGTAEEIPLAFPKAVYLRSSRNLGFAAAVDRAAKRSRGKYLLLLNSDARLEPDALERAVRWMEAAPQCGVAGAQLHNEDGSLQNSIANFPSLWTELGNRSLLRRFFPARFPGKERSVDHPTVVDSVIGACFLTRADLWQRLHGMDEGFFFFLEETDFCYRARQAGFLVYHLPDVHVWHGQGRSAAASPAAARIEYWRSRYRYFALHAPRSHQICLRIALPIRLVAELAGDLLIFPFQRTRPRFRERLGVRWSLLLWHLAGRPERMGLPRE
ncbi:N-acetylglucosaminyl-diphospho-decaprenol L-rhamnosyltransferase [Methylacidimicrobium tartarophylax]|uniref:N-acetylglucosaminyl-diphospho-decaprenol L-rhamnosyltransferase n=1 Tax=Methylacidimicrobium tartarophylax TaxID=1041768 RepID=A0A5E6MDJ9_9BACT|nr:N-acetylglucosaminyl-diphospho-decaprenol L-rhamnosyltransferase [Methylacidimicrobium tartarophylax]